MKRPHDVFLLLLGMGAAVAATAQQHRDRYDDYDEYDRRRYDDADERGRPDRTAMYPVRVRPVAPFVRPALRPSGRHIWIDGEWSWGRGGYVFKPGYWVVPPRRGMTYIPGYWHRTRGGWVWVQGYWVHGRGRGRW